MLSVGVLPRKNSNLFRAKRRKFARNFLQIYFETAKDLISIKIFGWHYIPAKNSLAWLFVLFLHRKITTKWRLLGMLLISQRISGSANNEIAECLRLWSVNLSVCWCQNMINTKPSLFPSLKYPLLDSYTKWHVVARDILLRGKVGNWGVTVIIM